MKTTIEFIINTTKISMNTLQTLTRRLVGSFKQRYKHVGAKIQPHFSNSGIQIGWKIVIIAMNIIWK